MNEKQRDDLLGAIEKRMVDADDALFDKLDDARAALAAWDLQGAIPYEQQLREWGLLEAVTSPSETSAPPSSSSGDTQPFPSPQQVEAIHTALRRRIRTSAPGSEAYIAAKSVREKLRAWDGDSPLPHAEELDAWGIWPPRPEEETPKDQEEEKDTSPPPASDPDDELWPEFKAAQSLAAAQPYQAIQKLSDLRTRAQGALIKRIESELSQARVDLENRTAALIAAARRVKQEKPRDYVAQADAWRDVTALNPQSREAQEALTHLQQRVREAIEVQLITIKEEAHQAAGNDQLRALNTCRGDIEALCMRPDLPEDLAERAEELKATVLQFIGETRERLSVAPTALVQGDFKRAYRLAKEYKERGVRIIPIPEDAQGPLGITEREMPTGEFSDFASSKFLSGTRSQVDEYLQRARHTKQENPASALEDLEIALGWLTDEVWMLDHRQALAPQREEVEREIKDVQRLIKRYEAARENVIAAQQPGVEAREQLRLLTEARERYPNHPSIQEYIAEARDNLAGELAGEIAAQIATAREHALQEQFDAARETLQQAREEALRAVPKPKSDSSLAQAIARLAQEEDAVAQAEKALQDFEQLIAEVRIAVDEYDEKKELLRLQEARALLEQIPERFAQHAKATEARSWVTARQGDAENYAAGRRAYEQRNWASARDYFNKVTSAYDQYAEAEVLSKRAWAAMFAAAALSLSQALTAQEDRRRMINSGLPDKDMVEAADQRAKETMEAARNALQNLPESQIREESWAVAYHCYKEAMLVFDGETGEDERTADLAAACRMKKESLDQIAQADEELRGLMNQAREAVDQVMERTQKELQLFERLTPLSDEFKSYVSQLEAALQQRTLVKNELVRLLSAMRSAWRKACIPTLQEVVENEGQNVEPRQIDLVRQLVEELRTANLLYDDDQFNNLGDLYYQVRSIQLDRAYTLLNEAKIKDWAAIAENRRELLDLPGTDQEKKKAARQAWDEARRKQIEAELNARRDDEGPKAALAFLGAQIRAQKVPTTSELLQRWIKLCWAAEDWDEAEKVVPRFGALGAPNAQTQCTIWQELTRIARSYAEDDIRTAENYTAELKKQIEDPIIDEEIETLEKRTLDRLLNTTTAEQKRLDAEKDAEPADYLPVARGYAKVTQLSPKHKVATDGLGAISEKLKPFVTQFCSKVKSLRIGRGGLAEAIKEADRLLNEWDAIEAIRPHLTLEKDTEILLDEAHDVLAAKKNRWDQAQEKLQQAHKEIKDALAAPDAPYKDSGGEMSGMNYGAPVAEAKFVGGGWDFSEARTLLTEIKTQAVQAKDKGLQSLIKRELSTLNNYTATAERLRKLACDLLTAIDAEKFEQVRKKVKEIQIAWQQATAQPVGWDDLGDILKYTYSYPQSRKISKLQKHYKFSIQQQENLSAWEAHGHDISRLYTALTGADKYVDFLKDELSDLKLSLSLQEIDTLCDTWTDQCTEFLQELEKTTNMQPALSKSAAKVKQKVNYVDRKRDINDKREHVAKIKTEAEQALADLQEPLGRLRNHYNGLPRRVKRSKSPSEGDVQLARKLYQQCQVIDPLNPEVQRLRKRLEAVGYRFQ